MPGKNHVPGLYQPFGIGLPQSAERKRRGLDVELKNGRLAMIAFMGLYSTALIPGAVSNLLVYKFI